MAPKQAKMAKIPFMQLASLAAFCQVYLTFLMPLVLAVPNISNTNPADQTTNSAKPLAAASPGTLPLSVSTSSPGMTNLKLQPGVLKTTSSSLHQTIAPQEVTLNNGLKVVILEDHSFPVVSCLSWYKVGARNEIMGATGLSHLVEHLLCRNAGSFHKDEIGTIITQVGGQFNGYSSDDFIAFFETLPAYNLELALRIESERMHGCAFKDTDVREEIHNIQAEFESESKEPLIALAREVRAALYQQHPYHNPTIGWRTDVENLNTQQVKAFYDAYFHPDNATLFLVGNLETQNAISLVQKYFGDISGTGLKPIKLRYAEPPQAGERRVVVKYPGKQESLQIAYHAPALEETDAATMSVLEHLLNSTSTGRLKLRLLDPKICSAAVCSFEAKKDPGLFSFTCTATPGIYNAQQKILEILDTLLSQLKNQTISDVELRRAKRQAEFAFYSELESPYKMGLYLGLFESLANWRKAYSWGDRLQAVTASDIQKVVKRYFNPDSRVIGWLAGAAAPKGQPPKLTPDSDGPKDKDKNQPSKFMHMRMTGYKEDDSAIVSTNSSYSQSSVQQLPLLKTPASEGVEQKPLKRVLKNGLTLLIYENHLSPIVEIQGAIRAGEVCDPAGKSGLSALAATILNQGSQKHNLSYITTIQEDLGISPSHMLKFEGGFENIRFHNRCMSRNLPAQMELFAEALVTPALLEENFEEIKQKLIVSMKQYEEDAVQRINRALRRSLLTANSPFVPQDPFLKAKSVSSLSLKEEKKFFADTITPAATTIVVAGDVNPDYLSQLAERHFGTWKGKSTPISQNAQANNRRILKVTIPLKDNTKSIVCFGQLIPAAPLDYGSLLIANTILANHPIISRCVQRLNDKPFLANVLPPEIAMHPVSDYLIWSLTAIVEPGIVPTIIDTLQTEMRNLASTNVTPEEFNESKRYLIGTILVRNFATMSATANTILENNSNSDNSHSWKAILASIRSASLDSVNKAIRAMFKEDSATLVIASTAQTINAVRRNQAKVYNKIR